MPCPISKSSHAELIFLPPLADSVADRFAARAIPWPLQVESMNQVILLDDGWKRLKEGGVQKIEQILENVQGGDYKSGITTEEYSTLYTTVYTMCTQKPPNNWSEVIASRARRSAERDQPERRASRLTAQPHLRPACFVTDPAAHMRIRVLGSPRHPTSEPLAASLQQLLRCGQGLLVSAHSATHQREA